MAWSREVASVGTSLTVPPGIRIVLVLLRKKVSLLDE
jgi:hypothetical protein